MEEKGADEVPKKGVRVHALTPQYKYAVREFHLLSNVSERKQARTHAGLLWESMKLVCSGEGHGGSGC